MTRAVQQPQDRPRRQAPGAQSRRQVRRFANSTSPATSSAGVTGLARSARLAISSSAAVGERPGDPQRAVAEDRGRSGVAADAAKARHDHLMADPQELRTSSSHARCSGCSGTDQSSREAANVDQALGSGCARARLRSRIRGTAGTRAAGLAHRIGQLVVEIGEEAERLGRAPFLAHEQERIWGASRRIACIAWTASRGARSAMRSPNARLPT